MTSPALLVRRTSPAALAGFIGGGLLLGSVVIRVVEQPLPFPFAGTVSLALFSAALFVFAFGIRGAGSITARRPLGTTALALLAIWLLLGSVLYGVITESFSNNPVPNILMAFAYADSFVQFALALTAVMQIARLGAVPAPWNWVPAGVTAAVTLTWVLLQLVGSGSPTLIGPNAVSWFLMILDGLARIGGTMLLGVIAIVLADRTDRASRTSSDKRSNLANDCVPGSAPNQ